MKKFSRIFAVLMVLLLVVATVPAAFAAGTAPGKTATVSFSFKNIYGIDGEFTFSNPDIITNIKYSSNTDCTFGNNKVIYHGENSANVTITITCTVKSTAKDGDKCDVSFEYETADQNGDMSPFNTVTKSIVVEVPEQGGNNQGGNNQGGGGQGGSNQGSTGTGSGTGTTAVDYTELKKQIAIAKGLTNDGYSAESWAALEAALKTAEAAQKSKNQKNVDAAAAALAEAIKGLQKLDYAPLKEAIEKTEAFLGKDEFEGKLNNLIDALSAARELLGNAKDQASINAAAEALTKALSELDTLLQKLQEGEGITEIEVEPKGDYCNIRIHYVWPILFFISLAVNVVFIALAVVYFVRKKKNQTDNTPLVDYDIGEDAE